MSVDAALSTLMSKYETQSVDMSNIQMISMLDR